MIDAPALLCGLARRNVTGGLLSSYLDSEEGGNFVAQDQRVENLNSSLPNAGKPRCALGPCSPAASGRRGSAAKRDRTAAPQKSSTATLNLPAPHASNPADGSGGRAGGGGSL